MPSTRSGSSSTPVKDLTYYVRRFTSLHANVRPDTHTPSPHKPVMLLAVLEAFDLGEMTENRIEFTPRLTQRFAPIFNAVRRDGDQCSPQLPFFHLRSDGFWHLRPRAGQEPILTALRQIRSTKQLVEVVDHASLDAELYDLLLQRESRDILRQALIDTWFKGAVGQSLRTVLQVEHRTSEYERLLLDQVGSSCTREPSFDLPKNVRTEAFRRAVREAYDYRCAATGWRLLLPDGSPLVEAAHLIPFRETADDDPRNGIALLSTYHDLLDNHVIAPGPGLKWHVSPLVDRRIPDNRDLCGLDGQKLLLPRDTRYYPRLDALEWRIRRLAR